MSEITVVKKFVGIDVSKNTLDVCIDPDTEVLHVAYDGTRMEGVCQRLKAVSPTLIVVEATGGLKTRCQRIGGPGTERGRHQSPPGT